jgi:outer membrane lipoprotein-sorting protein
MRKIILSTALAVFAITSISAQNLDKVLNDFYKASAQEKMSKIKTVSTTGKISIASMGMEAGIAIYQSRPNNLRIELNIQGSKIITTYNGTTGWMYAPAMGVSAPQEMGADELKTVQTQAEFESPLWKYEEKGHKAELDGESEDGKAHQVKLTMANGDVMTFLISKETNLLSGMTSNQVVMGSETEALSSMKDYKTVKGIPVAHYMSTSMAGQVVTTITMEKVEYNKELDAALFEKPVVE